MKYVIAIIATVALAWLAHSMDLAKGFGAHPWWSQKIIASGAAIGLTLAVLFSLIVKNQTVTTIFAALISVAAFGVAKYGQTQFAASYAEDAFAGKLWFFGWHATSAAIFATLALLALALIGAAKGKNSP